MKWKKKLLKLLWGEFKRDVLELFLGKCQKSSWSVTITERFLCRKRRIQLCDTAQRLSLVFCCKLDSLLERSLIKLCLPAAVFSCLGQIPLVGILSPLSRPPTSSSSGVTWMPISTGSTTFLSSPRCVWWCRLCRVGLPPPPPLSAILS